jgi:hypothetical protein
MTKILIVSVFFIGLLFSEEEAIKNGGFESGKANWLFTLHEQEGGIDDITPHEGSKSLLFKGESTHDDQVTGSTVKVSYWVKSENPGVKYQVYFDIRAKVGESSEASWYSSVSKVKDKPVGPTRNLDLEWTKVEYEFVFPEDQPDKNGSLCKMAALILYIRLYSDGEIRFDDFSVMMNRR